MQTEDILKADLPSLTEQLQRFAAGDRLISDQVLRAVFPELHRIARRALGRHGESICATELINEFWLKKLRRGWQIENRQHFYALAAFAMRQVLIELARARKAGRRGGPQLPALLNADAPVIDAQTADPDTVIQLGILMDRLEKKNPRAARIVDLCYFAGFTLKEASTITGLTFAQVRHLWEQGQDWLKDGLSR